MALAIDTSTPAVVTNSNNSTATITTASFTPPAGSLLLIRWAGNTQTAVAPSSPTITDSLGAHLTYTLLDWQSRADSPTREAQAACWWAVVGSSAAMTVTVTSGAASGSRVSALHVTVITGQHATPIGAHGKLGSASTASIAQSYTASASSGWGFIAAADWDDKGAQTAGTGCTLTNGGSASITGQISYAFARRTSADDVNGNANSLNLTLPGTSTNLAWVYAEVLPAAAAATSGVGQAVVLAAARAPAPAVVLLGQMRDVTPIAAIDTPPRIVVIAAPRARSGPGIITSRSTADPAPGDALPRSYVVADPARRQGVAPIVLHSWVEQVGPDSTFVVLPAPQRGTGFLATSSTRPEADGWPTVLVVARSTPLRSVAPIVLASRAEPSVVAPGVLAPIAYVIASPPARRTPGAIFVGRAPDLGDCHLPRPDSGGTARPGSGVTARPLASTARPAGGLTARPDLGSTANPC